MYQKSQGGNAFWWSVAPPPLRIENYAESALSPLAKGSTYRNLWILNELEVKLNAECSHAKWVEFCSSTTISTLD